MDTIKKENANCVEPYTRYLRGWLIPLLRSATLREEYRAYRHRDMVSFVRVGGFLLLCLIYLLILFSAWLFHAQLPAPDARLWMLGSLLVAVMATIPVVLVQFARFRRHFDLVAVPFSAIIITKFAVVSTLYEHPGASIAESYFCMLAILIIALAIRLSLLSVVLCLSATMLASTLILLGLLPVASIPWERLCYYLFGTSLVCISIAMLQDVHQSANFRLARLVDQQAAALRRLAQEDPLTGLANRRGFDQILKHEWLSHQRQQKSLGVLFIDVDHFKAYNDHYGHDAGDHCLQQIARAISTSLWRASDIAARYGGEEFIVLLPDIHPEGAREVAERLLQTVDSLALPHEGLGDGRHVTVSIGVATGLPATTTSRQLLKDADDALYTAKHQGRHQIMQAPGR